MKLTIGFVTGRHLPELPWALEGLASQRRPGDVIELVVVDALGRSLDELAPDVLVRAACDSSRCVQTMPNVWQGPSRVTSRDWWATGTAKNTVLVYASHDFVAFLDDRCRLDDGWLAAVRGCASTRRSVFAGAYEKHESDGKISVDHRLAIAPNGKIGCAPGWLFGGTFALPLDWALAVNGHEAGCDGLSMEDVILGLNLHNAGYRIDYVPAMKVRFDRPTGALGPVYARTDKNVSPNDKSHAALKRFGARRRTELTPDLRALRDLVRAGHSLPVPDPNVEPLDWYDSQPVREMVAPP